MKTIQLGEKTRRNIVLDYIYSNAPLKDYIKYDTIKQKYSKTSTVELENSFYNSAANPFNPHMFLSVLMDNLERKELNEILDLLSEMIGDDICALLAIYIDNQKNVFHSKESTYSAEKKAQEIQRINELSDMLINDKFFYKNDEVSPIGFARFLIDKVIQLNPENSVVAKIEKGKLEFSIKLDLRSFEEFLEDSTEVAEQETYVTTVRNFISYVKKANNAELREIIEVYNDYIGYDLKNILVLFLISEEHLLKEKGNSHLSEKDIIQIKRFIEEDLEFTKLNSSILREFILFAHNLISKVEKYNDISIDIKNSKMEISFLNQNFQDLEEFLDKHYQKIELKKDEIAEELGKKQQLKDNINQKRQERVANNYQAAAPITQADFEKAISKSSTNGQGYSKASMEKIKEIATKGRVHLDNADKIDEGRKKILGILREQMKGHFLAIDNKYKRYATEQEYQNNRFSPDLDTNFSDYGVNVKRFNEKFNHILDRVSSEGECKELQVFFETTFKAMNEIMAKAKKIEENADNKIFEELKAMRALRKGLTTGELRLLEFTGNLLNFDTHNPNNAVNQPKIQKFAEIFQQNSK